jgi:hypothetical protein
VNVWDRVFDPVIRPEGRTLCSQNMNIAVVSLTFRKMIILFLSPSPPNADGCYPFLHAM